MRGDRIHWEMYEDFDRQSRTEMCRLWTGGPRGIPWGKDGVWWAGGWCVTESRLDTGVMTGSADSGAHSVRSGWASDSNRVGVHSSCGIPARPSSTPHKPVTERVPHPLPSCQIHPQVTPPRARCFLTHTASTLCPEAGGPVTTKPASLLGGRTRGHLLGSDIQLNTHALSLTSSSRGK